MHQQWHEHGPTQCQCGHGSCQFCGTVYYSEGEVTDVADVMNSKLIKLSLDYTHFTIANFVLPPPEVELFNSMHPRTDM